MFKLLYSNLTERAHSRKQRTLSIFTLPRKHNEQLSAMLMGAAASQFLVPQPRSANNPAPETCHSTGMLARWGVGKAFLTCNCFSLQKIYQEVPFPTLRSRCVCSQLHWTASFTVILKVLTLQAAQERFSKLLWGGLSQGAKKKEELICKRRCSWLRKWGKQTAVRATFIERPGEYVEGCPTLCKEACRN